MPIFYFHLHDDMNVPDHEGVDLPDLEVAIVRSSCEARIFLCEMAKQAGRIVLHHRIDIEDAYGAVLESVQFGDVMKIEA